MQFGGNKHSRKEASMKRFLKLLSLTILAGILLAVFTIVQAEVCFKGAESYAFFCGDSSKNCREVSASKNTALKKLTLSDICGESAEYSSLDIDSFLKSVNGEIIFVEKLSDSVNYYCKADLPYSVTLYGEQINLHICVRERGIKVGTPLIFGGF